MNHDNPVKSSCSLPQEPDYSGITLIELTPIPPLIDYLQAMELAANTADHQFENHMLISWYDRDRDFESPQHASECHADSATPGYVDYALSHDATLKIDIEKGRFVFFYMQVEF